MTVKAFLNKPDNLINLGEVAKAMWPKNKSAHTYLHKKLHGIRPWTDKDTESALAILEKLGANIEKLKKKPEGKG